MNLNPELWIAMAAAALFYHYAVRRQLSPAVYVILSVAVSTVVMLATGLAWMGVLGAQAVLFALVLFYRRFRRP